MFFVWLGIAFAASVLAYLLYQDWLFFRGLRGRTAGVVYDHQRSTEDGSEYFSLKVRFETGDGKTIEFTDTFGQSVRKPAVGMKLAVVYPRSAPELARVRRPWLRPVIYTFMIYMLGTLLALAFGYLR